MDGHRKTRAIVAFLTLLVLTVTTAQAAEAERESSRSGGSAGGRSDDGGGRSSGSAGSGSATGSTTSGGTASGMAAGSGSSGVLGSFFGGGSDSSATQQDAYRPADHELAKDAVARGQILALSTVIAQLERIAPGRRLSVALRRRGAGWAYDFSVLATNGVVRRVVIDARSNKILELRDVP